MTGRQWTGLGLGVGVLIGAACNPRIARYEERGDRYSAQGDYVDALVEYQLALDEAGTDQPSELRVKAGTLALRSKNFSAANGVFARLVTDDPEHWGEVIALYQLHAYRWNALGDTFSALQAIDWLLARDSTANLGALYFTLGDAAFARPDYDQAISAYLLGLAQAADQAPPNVYIRLGEAFERKRHCAAALPYFRRYLVVTRGEGSRAGDAKYQTGECAFQLAERAFANDDFASAKRYIDVMIRTGEPVRRLDEAELVLARIAEREGDRGAALAHYQRILARDPSPSSRPALEAFRRVKQIEFGLPLLTAELVAADRARAARGRSRQARP
ncbi:MAG: tetratricopeptide repeat protein [Gemmatimonadota bacterium]